MQDGTENLSTIGEGNSSAAVAEKAAAPQPVPQFVTVKGGAYFFMPGLRALKWIASL